MRGNNTSIGIDLSSVLNHGSSRIKKKMRDIRRLLKKDGLPSDLVIANERALKTLEMELANVETNKKAQKFASRYHKVRFFERKKAGRHYKHEKRKLEQLKDEKHQLKKEKKDYSDIKKQIKEQEAITHKRAVEYAYTLNFPDTEKYISIYRTNNEDPEKMSRKAQKGLKKVETKRRDYLQRYSDELDQGKLKVSLEEGLTHRGGKGSKQKKHENNPQKKQIDATEKKPAESDDFFEE